MKKIIKHLLNERLFNRHSQPQIDILNKFISFVTNYLKIKDVTIKLLFNHNDLTTTADYGNNNVRVYAKDRALVDIMRSIAHELYHAKQDQFGELTDAMTDGMDGSPIENDANATAGIIIRKFGKLYPQIYL